MTEKESKSVQDYWKFTRDLRSQLNLLKVLERQFFELDDLCEYAIKNNITCLNDQGERVSVVDDCLCGQQREVYMKMMKAVRDLDMLMVCGEDCFTNKSENDGTGHE